jgi:hypothetical protein
VNGRDPSAIGRPGGCGVTFPNILFDSGSQFPQNQRSRRRVQLRFDAQVAFSVRRNHAAAIRRCPNTKRLKKSLFGVHFVVAALHRLGRNKDVARLRRFEEAPYRPQTSRAGDDAPPDRIEFNFHDASGRCGSRLGIDRSAVRARAHESKACVQPGRKIHFQLRAVQGKQTERTGIAQPEIRRINDSTSAFPAWPWQYNAAVAANRTGTDLRPK